MVNVFPNIAEIEAQLYSQLVVLGLVMGLGAYWFGDWRWMMASVLGSAAAFLYYRLLAWGLSNRFRRRKVMTLLSVASGLVFRQLVCIAIPTGCFVAWGSPAFGCLFALLVARHWIFVVAWPREMKGTLA